MSKTHRVDPDDLEPVQPVEPVTPDDLRVNDPQHEDAESGEQKRR